MKNLILILTLCLFSGTGFAQNLKSLHEMRDEKDLSTKVDAMLKNIDDLKKANAITDNASNFYRIERQLLWLQTNLKTDKKYIQTKSTIISLNAILDYLITYNEGSVKKRKDKEATTGAHPNPINAFNDAAWTTRYGTELENLEKRSLVVDKVKAMGPYVPVNSKTK